MSKTQSFSQAFIEKDNLPQSGKVKVLVRFNPKLKKTGQKTTGANISIAVDVSTSMLEPIKQPSYPHQTPHNPPVWAVGHQPFMPNIQPPFGGWHGHEIQPIVQSKINQAIGAALKAVDNMQNGDRLSLIAFNGGSRVMMESVVITDESRQTAKNAISSLRASGNTNLHAGWMDSAEQVAKSIDAKKLNRVLLLSDGETNSGKRDIDSICGDVSRLNEAGVSTTTFGIGDRFNEDLLSKMADSGNGNFYFIDDDGKIDQWFAEEFKGLARLVGQNARLEFIPAEGVKIAENINDYIFRDGKWIVPNLIHDKPVDSLFVLELDKTKGKKTERSLGSFVLTYLDAEGVSISETIAIEGESVKKEAYAELAENHEVKVINALLEIARSKREATIKMSQGDFVGAKGMLMASANFAASVNDARTMTETSSLNSTISSYDNGDKAVLRKSMVSQSYNTRNSK